MDPQALVKEQIDLGGELVERFDKFMPVKSAFWLKPPDHDSWSLYIAAERVKQEGASAGHREIVRICQEINDPNLDMFKVRLIPDDHPWARAASDYNLLYPGKPIRHSSTLLGGLSIDGAYIYPAPAAIGNP